MRKNRAIWQFLLPWFLFACAHEHDHRHKEESYSCTVEGASLSATGSNYAATSCANLPVEGIKINLNNLTVPMGELFGLRFFTNPAENNLAAAGGAQIEFSNSQVTAQYANGASPQSQPLGGATSFCLEIHNITQERHIQIYPGTSCSGTPIIDLDDSSAPVPTARGMAYRKSSAAVTLGSISVVGEAHGH